jgi:predicted LPLAT superfamily acyltransferase
MFSLNRRKDGSTYGNAWMYRTIIFMLKHINIKVFYWFMAVVVIPPTLIFSPGARLTYRYFRQKRALGRLKSWWYTYRNHCIFGQTVIDKFAMYAGHKFKITYHGLDEFIELEKDSTPLLLLNAHIGCSEIIGYSLRLTKPCNVLVFGGEKQSLMNYRKSSFGDMNMRMIPVGIETSHSDEIIKALDNGETISAFADRFMNAKKLIVSKVHGHQINLAKGPFSIAVNRGMNVMMISAMKECDGSYTSYMTPLHYDKTLAKSSEQRQQIADAYTAEIDRLLDLYPLQWFNYSDPWVNS